jgi:hypothetical protein
MYVAFIVDVFSRMIVGWQASRSRWGESLTYAVEMAVHNRGRTDNLEGLIHHSDRSTYLCATPSGSPTTTSSPRSAREVTATTTPSWRASTGSTSGSSSTPRDHGPGSRTSNGPRSATSLVQPTPTPRGHHPGPRLHHPGGLRDRLLPSDHPDRGGRDSIATASTKPGAVQAVGVMAIRAPSHIAGLCFVWFQDPAQASVWGRGERLLLLAFRGTFPWSLRSGSTHPRRGSTRRQSPDRS